MTTKREWCGGPAGAVVSLIVLIIFVLVAVGCGAPSSPPAATDHPTTTERTIVEIHAKLPDLPMESATRVTTSTLFEQQAAPFDCATYVNGLDYGSYDMAPAMEAYRIGALCRGWPQESIDRFAPFAYDIMIKESSGCPNTKGGDLFVEGTCDQYTREGTAEDSGFGQATYSFYGPTGATCTILGLCSQAAIIANPWASILGSVIVPLEVSGRYPWCDYKGAPKLHDCSLLEPKELPL